MIQLVDFSIGYGASLLLEKVSAVFKSSSLTALIGRNGTGKSTLLRAIAGIKHNYYGRILIDNKDIQLLNRLQLARILSFVNTQRPHIANLSVFDVVALGRSPYTDWSNRISDLDHNKIIDAIAAVGMASYIKRDVNTLSDGECQRVMIARAIAQDTKVIILDEPTSYLDLPTRYEIVELLKTQAHDFGKTILFSTHELDIAFELSDFISAVDDKKLITLPPSEIIKSDYLQRSFRLPENYLNRFRLPG